MVMKRILLLSSALFLLGGCNNAPSNLAPGLVQIPGKCAQSVTTQQAGFSITNIVFTLSPLGRLTTVGNLPLGGAITPDGKQYWALDSGYGLNDVQIVELAGGKGIETLPLPGAFGGMVFAPDGLTAYVAGEPVGSGNRSEEDTSELQSRQYLVCRLL